jgi:hypothetical protein
MSLWRFSIYVKLLTCIAAAFVLLRWGKVSRAAVVAMCVIVIAIGVSFQVARGHAIAMSSIPEDDPAYLELCDWVRLNTPVDAVFLMPPQEQAFRLRAQRAIVVNFKHVPQLSRQFPAWRDRMEDVLDLPDLRQLPTPFPNTFPALRDRYEAQSPQRLSEVARKYGARYIVSGHRIDGLDLVFSKGEWFLYDRGVDKAEMEKRILDAYGIRLEPQTLAYLQQQLDSPNRPATIAVMGGDARTGVPVRAMIDPMTFSSSPSASSR